MYKKAVRNVGRQVYKATGYKNPMKKGKLMTSRVAKQIPKMLTDISRLKGIINSEKFRVESQPFSDSRLGQVDGNNSGHLLVDFTPVPSQGDGFNNRQGQSIRWKASHYSFFVQRQTNNVARCTMKIQLIKVIGEPFTTLSNILGRFIEPDRWINTGTVYDTASDRKPEYFRNFRVLRTKTITFPGADYAGQAVLTQKIVNFGLKLPKHHVKWNNNSNTLTSGQVLCLITMDTGNSSATTTSTLDSIANNQTNTGLFVNCNKVDYYYDN
nr:MAG: capsid protein [Owegonang virus 21]